ncbi:MAG: formate/nitrite transporter family protein [Candidatus Rokubacteria bacterium]|nr:formate/nitrite transporter family protein [Candidatus Rokubacteria bacterium]
MTTAARAPVGSTPSAIDALVPAEMARRAEDLGAAKAGMDRVRLFALAVLAGAFIALGGVFATVALAGTVQAPWGPARVLAGVVFSLGLVLVLVGGAELFTGNNLIVMAWAARRVTTPQLARNWVIVFCGNFVGAIGIAGLVFVGRTHEAGGGAFGSTALAIASTKLALGGAQAVALGILCNVLVCLAVWLTFSARSTTDRILATVLPISAFVAAGFEHSIANMYFVPLALFIARFDPGFVVAHGLAGHADALSWSQFLVANLVPVTVGNVIGGTLLVGIVYWFVYLRPVSHEPPVSTRP